MARVTVEDCLDNVDNRFELVMLATKRARQIATGGKEPKVAWENDKPTVVALREIASGLVDRVALFLAPRLVGGGVPVACGPGLGVERALALGPFTVTPLGPDLLLQAEVVPAHG